MKFKLRTLVILLPLLVGIFCVSWRVGVWDYYWGSAFDEVKGTQFVIIRTLRAGPYQLVRWKGGEYHVWKVVKWQDQVEDAELEAPKNITTIKRFDRGQAPYETQVLY